jgi:hypothetical protein
MEASEFYLVPFLTFLEDFKLQVMYPSTSGDNLKGLCSNQLPS